MDFYENLADTYDEMVGSAGREQRIAEVTGRLHERMGFASVLDAACGTGLHAVLLAQRGVRVVAADLSGGMLRVARRRAEAAGVDVHFVEAPMQQLGAMDELGRVDAVLCLGNSIPHLLEARDLAAALEGFCARLNPGGQALIQLVNYAPILAEQRRVLSVDRRGGTEFVRFYDFLEGVVRFNVLTIDWGKPAEQGSAIAQQPRPQHRLDSTLLRPYTHKDLPVAVKRAGFARVEVFGDAAFGPFDPATSPGLWLLARRG